MGREQALRREVFREMGALRGGPLSRTTNPQIQEMLRPFEKEAYPLNRFHDYSRVPWEHITEWVDLEKLESTLRENERINSLAEKNPGAFSEAVQSALKWRAIKAYEEEWKYLSGEDISKQVVNPSGGLPGQANSANAFNAVQSIRETISRKGRARLMDLGTGGGGTILPIIRMLTPEERENVEVHLVDVMRAGLNATRKKLKGLGVKKIKTIKTNFYDLSVAVGAQQKPERTFNPLRIVPQATLNAYARRAKGKMDVIVSGAALHHASDMQPVFRGLTELLSEGGRLHLFDWGHHRTSSRNVDLDSEKMRREVKVTHGYAPSVKDTVTSMTDAWLSLWGYGENSESRRKLRRDLKKGRNFNFEKWIQENIKILKKEAPKDGKWKPFALEGHRLPDYYQQGLKNAGLTVDKLEMPFAKPGKISTGNLLYVLSATKRQS